jgi:hypothetical protein
MWRCALEATSSLARPAEATAAWPCSLGDGAVRTTGAAPPRRISTDATNPAERIVPSISSSDAVVSRLIVTRPSKPAASSASGAGSVRTTAPSVRARWMMRYARTPGIGVLGSCATISVTVESFAAALGSGRRRFFFLAGRATGGAATTIRPPAALRSNAVVADASISSSRPATDSSIACSSVSAAAKRASMSGAVTGRSPRLTRSSSVSSSCENSATFA